MVHFQVDVFILLKESKVEVSERTTLKSNGGACFCVAVSALLWTNAVIAPTVFIILFLCLFTSVRN